MGTSAEAVMVLMYVGSMFLGLLIAAMLLVVGGVFIASMLGGRGMGHSNTWQGKLRYAFQHVFG